MQLKGRDKKLVLYCTYQERDFPKSLKARWDGKLKGWTFSPSMLVYNLIQEEAKKKKIEIHIDEAIRVFFNKKKKALEDFSLNGEMKTKPYKHQYDMTKLITRDRKCLIFGGVGTGKSKAAIDAVTFLSNEVKKVLVVSPFSIMWNFGAEIKTHSHFDYTIIFGSLEKRKQLIADSQTVFDIINYEILDKMKKDIEKKRYDMIIFDEIHYCKSRQSNRSKASQDISKDINIRVGLTGTIISNSYEDLFMPYKIIDETVFGPHFTKFKERYFITANWSGYDETIGYKNEEELKRLVASNSIKFEIRDVIDNLPKEQNIIKTVNLNNKSKRIYRDLKNHMVAEHGKGEIVASNVLERLIRFSQITSGYLVDKENGLTEDIGTDKLDVLKETLFDIKEKIVIFCRFTRSIDRVAKLCEELGKSYYIYDGRTKEKDLYLRFNTDDTQVWIAQLQKSEGYSLPNAQYCIFYELDYSRKNHIQSRGRILRASGSKHNCIFYMYMIARNTIDEAIYNALKEKDFRSKEALEFVIGGRD